MAAAKNTIGQAIVRIVAMLDLRPGFPAPAKLKQNPALAGASFVRHKKFVRYGKYIR